MRALALALLAAGCTQHTDLFPADGGTPCTGLGPPITLGAQAPCAGALAAKQLRYAICSCAPLVLTRGLFTQGGGGPMMPGPMGNPPAAVGTDGDLQVAGPVQIAGALHAGGPNGMSFGRTSAVLGTLRSGGPLGTNQFLSIDRDAFVAGDVIGRIDIGDLLHVPDGAFIGPQVSAAGLVREDVAAPAPCGCAAGSAIDVPGLVKAHALANDDARIGLSPDAFANGGGPNALALPCGAFYLSALAAPDKVLLPLGVHGRAALFIGGDVSLGGGLAITLDAGAELDLVVAGNLTVTTGELGGPASASIRLWLGSTAVKLGPGASLAASVYAPTAVMESDGDLTATGALFAQEYAVAGDLTVRFDPAVLGGGASCGVGPEPPVD